MLKQEPRIFPCTGNGPRCVGQRTPGTGEHWHIVADEQLGPCSAFASKAVARVIAEPHTWNTELHGKLTKLIDGADRLTETRDDDAEWIVRYRAAAELQQPSPEAVVIMVAVVLADRPLSLLDLLSASMPDDYDPSLNNDEWEDDLDEMACPLFETKIQEGGYEIFHNGCFDHLKSVLTILRDGQVIKQTPQQNLQRMTQATVQQLITDPALAIPTEIAAALNGRIYELFVGLEEATPPTAETPPGNPTSAPSAETPKH